MPIIIRFKAIQTIGEQMNSKLYRHNYYLRNLEREKARNKKYYLEHKEKLLEYGREYRKNHRDKMAEYQRNCRQRKKEEIYKICNLDCLNCVHPRCILHE